MPRSFLYYYCENGPVGNNWTDGAGEDEQCNPVHPFPAELYIYLLTLAYNVANCLKRVGVMFLM